MLRKDLAAARQAWLKEAGTPKEKAHRERTDFLKATDTAGRVVDFHSLRHTYVTRVVRGGASAKVAQDLARHSTPALTLGVYTHMTVHDHSAALGALPPIEWGEPEHQAARATGTEDAAQGPTEGRPARSAFSARRLPRAPSPVMTPQERGSKGRKARGAQVLGKVATCGHLSSPVMVGEEGVEPSWAKGPGDFKSPASAVPPLARSCRNGVVRQRLPPTGKCPDSVIPGRMASQCTPGRRRVRRILAGIRPFGKPILRRAAVRRSLGTREKGSTSPLTGLAIAVSSV